MAGSGHQANSDVTSEGLLKSIGSGPTVRHALELARRAAMATANVLILAEPGNGQAELAHAIHAWSPFSNNHILAVRAELVNEDFFRQLHTQQHEEWLLGTLYIENLQSLSLEAQGRLVDWLRNQSYLKGSNQAHPARVIASAMKDLISWVSAGKFDPELFHLLQVIEIDLPPLRERVDDIGGLVDYYLAWFGDKNNRGDLAMTDEAKQALTRYAWPGNLVELKCYVERAVVLAESNQIAADLLPTQSLSPIEAESKPAIPMDMESLARELVQLGVASADEKAKDLHSRVVDRVEKELIAQVLVACDHVQTKAATRLGINRNTLHKKIKDYKLDDPGK